MFTKSLSALVVAAIVAAPLSFIATSAEAKTANQVKNEHKGKVAKAKSAAKSSAKKSSKK